MAVKRTKKQKQQTAQRREETLSYSINDMKLGNDRESNNNKIKLPKEQKKAKSSISFDTSHVVKDLTKTVVVTLLVVGVLIAYTIYIK